MITNKETLADKECHTEDFEGFLTEDVKEFIQEFIDEVENAIMDRCENKADGLILNEIITKKAKQKFGGLLK